MTPETIRLIRFQHRLKWTVTMVVAFLGIGLVVALKMAHLYVPFLKYILVPVPTWGVHYVMGKKFPLSRFHNSPAMEDALKELAIQKAREKMENKRRK